MPRRGRSCRERPSPGPFRARSLDLGVDLVHGQAVQTILPSPTADARERPFHASFADEPFELRRIVTVGDTDHERERLAVRRDGDVVLGEGTLDRTTLVSQIPHTDELHRLLLRGVCTNVATIVRQINCGTGQTPMPQVILPEEPDRCAAPARDRPGARVAAPGRGRADRTASDAAGAVARAGEGGGV